MARNTALWVGGGLVVLYLLSRGGLGMGAGATGPGGGLNPAGYTPGMYGGYGGYGGGLTQTGYTPGTYGGGGYAGGYGGTGTTYA